MAWDLPIATVSGTSAGAGCAMNFRSGQRGISLDMMLVPKKERYFSVQNFLRTGRFVNLNQICLLYNKRLNFDAFQKSEILTDFAATSCEIGEPVYLSDHGDKKRLYQSLMASCALPIVCPSIEIDDAHYVDGSIADPIPFSHLLDLGCNKVIVILTGFLGCHPTNYRKLKPLLWQCYSEKYPKLYHAILHRIERYQNEVHQMQQAVAEKRVFVLRPETTSILLFTKQPDKIQAYYKHGEQLVQKKQAEIQAFLDAPIIETPVTYQKIENPLLSALHY